MSGPVPVRLNLVIRGAVQGVGFRPFVYRLANEMGLAGWVRNDTEGLFIEVEGSEDRLSLFRRRLIDETPRRAVIRSLEARILDSEGFEGFRILASTEGGRAVLIMPDLATCLECRAELFNPSDRRFRYPFINCTNCGPRFSIIQRLPYDRPNTTMSRFALCADCLAEYSNPNDRRFHAQPIACPACGPSLQFVWTDRTNAAAGEDALIASVAMIREGRIVAVKGLGGFQLLVDAGNDQALRRLRERKLREEKPFAVMAVSLEEVSGFCDSTSSEQQLLQSPESPIVLLRRRSQTGRISREVAPGNPYLGVMLPYTPLHQLLLHELQFPIVATSGNLTDEPICISNQEALERLGSIADGFLLHDRPIARYVDDSVVRIVAGRELVLRRARGYAPLPVSVKGSLPPILALGGHLKNTVAVSVGDEVFVSQHIGDLETVAAVEALDSAVADLPGMYEVAPDLVACDLHPDYVSTRVALRRWGNVHQVQHHYAHALSCMAENELDPPVLGVSWDGTGFGPDGTVWGGEFLRVGCEGFERVASFRRFRLPGGEKAAREPRRSALGLLYELLGEALWASGDLLPLTAFTQPELRILRKMLEEGINSPFTSSVGRLFDAVASLAGVRQSASFEGQAAMEVEFLAGEAATAETYLGSLAEGGDFAVVDWGGWITAMLSDLQNGVPIPLVMAKFHRALSLSVVEVAKLSGESRVVMSGGCFQNRLLIEQCIAGLREAGFKAYWHQRIPPNDGGISLGQVMAVACKLRTAAGSKSQVVTP